MSQYLYLSDCFLKIVFSLNIFSWKNAIWMMIVILKNESYQESHEVCPIISDIKLYHFD